MQRNRAGFTLIELLIVIVVIGILMALLIPVVTTAMNRARDAEVVTEISSVKAAIVSFQAKLGTVPPSFIVLPEDATHWLNTANWDSTPPVSGIGEVHRRFSRAQLRELWPDFDFFYGGSTASPGRLDINGDGDDTDVLVLNGSEAFAFFIGGIMRRVDRNNDGINESWAANGFSTNPAMPFVVGDGNRIGPFMEMDAGRLMDLDAELGNPDEAMPEYKDTLPGQTRPYQYFSAYGNDACHPFGLDYDPSSATNPSTVDDETLPDPVGLRDAYWSDSAGTNRYYVSAWQLISPGRDGDFGVGGFYDGNQIPAGREPERDNITSFKNGRLN